MAISKSAIASLLKSQALASDVPTEEVKAEDPAEVETDTVAAEDLSDADFASNCRELLTAESNAEALASLKSMLEAAAAIAAETEEESADEVVMQAIASGKIAPAARATAKALAIADMASFKSFLKSAPSLSTARVQPVKRATTSEEIVLTPEQLKACASVGSTPESFKKTLLSLQKNPIVSKGKN